MLNPANRHQGRGRSDGSEHSPSVVADGTLGRSVEERHAAQSQPGHEQVSGAATAPDGKRNYWLVSMDNDARS
jgi:hypothetical protein